MKRIHSAKLLLGSIAVCLTAGLAIAQTESEFERWKKQEQGEFQNFKDDKDTAFAAFLKQEWHKMQVMKGLIPDETPKPIDMPVYTPPFVVPSTTTPAETPIVEQIPVPPPPEVRPHVKPQEPAPEVPAIPQVDQSHKTLRVTFFDSLLEIQYDDTLKVAFGDEIHKDAIGGFWEALSRADYKSLLAQALRHKKEMALNDWGYCLLLYKIGESLYQARPNPSHLFAWFMLSKFGYMAKVGYNADKIYLLLPSVNAVYGVQYAIFSDNSNRFYVISFDKQSNPSAGEMYTYDGGYPGADRLIDFKLDRLPKVGNREGQRTFKFT